VPEKIIRPGGVLDRLLRVDPESKPEVYLQIFDGTDINNLNYWIELLLSAAIATLGLVLNSPAVVIGAMLISPLMGPIIAAGLSLTVADVFLFVKSVGQLVLSTIAVILFAGFLVWALGYDAMTDEIAARTRPNFLDLGIALFSGLAASIPMARSKSKLGGGVSALPGVAVALALVPPLCTVGIGLGRGFEEPIMKGAGLLYLTNLVAIIASAFVVFFIVGLDRKEVRDAVEKPLEERARQDWLYHLVKERFHVVSASSQLSKLRWRVLLIAAVLAVVSVPLWESFQQLNRELSVRRAVRAARLIMGIEREEILSQQTSVGQEGALVRVRMTVTGRVAPDTVVEAERLIAAATGLSAELRVRAVVDDSEISQMAVTAPDSVQVETVDFLWRELLRRPEQPLKSLWPAELARLESYGVSLAHQGAEVQVRCEETTDQPIDEAARAILLRGLREWLDAPELELSLIPAQATGEMKAQ
jgi:uncharacterized hydrophobic protein (TIGR00271 family)